MCLPKVLDIDFGLGSSLGSTLAGISCALARAGCGPAVICGTVAVTVEKNISCMRTVQVLKGDKLNICDIKLIKSEL